MLPDRTLHVAWIVVAVALAGCVGSGVGFDADDPDTGPLTENREVDHGIELTATIDPGSVAPDEPVDVRLLARNVGDEPVDYREGCWHEWSLRIVAVEGDEAYGYPEVRCQGFSMERLEPGEEHGFAFDVAPEDWTSGEAPPSGMYRLETAFDFRDRGWTNVTTTLRLEVGSG